MEDARLNHIVKVKKPDPRTSQGGKKLKRRNLVLCLGSIGGSSQYQSLTDPTFALLLFPLVVA